MGFIVLFIFMGIIGTIVFLLTRAIKKIKIEGAKVPTSEAKIVSDYVPYEKIENGTIYLGNNKYRKVIECSSVNYNLKTPIEKEQIEASFARFLNSFKFPISFYIQTREIDLNDYLESLSVSANEVSSEFPSFGNYGNLYLEEMKKLPDRLGKAKQKKKYLIVSYDDTTDEKNLFGIKVKKEDKSKEQDDSDIYEKELYAIDELNLRTQTIIDNLSGVGVHCQVLNDYAINELLYHTFHRDNKSSFENIAEAGYLSSIMGTIIERDDNGNILSFINKNALFNQTDNQRALNALEFAKNIINIEVLGENTKNEQLYKEVVKSLEELSKEIIEIGGEKNV